MVLLDFGTGLRRGELSGVRWEDICFEDKFLIPKRSIVKQRIGKVKTEASKKSIPLDDVLIQQLLAWRHETPYAHDSDYVFASTKMRGKQPYWMSRIMQHPIKPVAAKTEIDIKGWHITPLLHDPAAPEQQQPQSGTRTAAACLVRNHDECLRRSDVGREAQRSSWSDSAAEP
jgi:integrase